MTAIEASANGTRSRRRRSLPDRSIGLNHDEITASNLVKIDVDGRPSTPGEHSINHAGFVVHSALHMTRSAESHVVMHTHTVAGMAVAAPSARGS